MPDRTVQRLLRNFELDPDSGCWLWQGAQNSKGYGYIRVSKGELLEHPRMSRVHRLALWIFSGPFDLELTVDHVCHRRLCFNPEHLSAESLSLNSFDGSMTRWHGEAWLEDAYAGDF